MKSAVLAIACSLVACGRDRHEVVRETDHYTRIVVDTAPGLSGLAAEPDGALWTIAERDARAYRIVLTDGSPTVQAFPIEGVPPRTDLEGIAFLGGGRFALGTEGHDAGQATVLLAERRDGSLAVTGRIALTQAQVGITLAANHGAEGLCGEGDTIVVAIEGAGKTGRTRWAPVVRVDRGVPARTYRVALTSPTGKLSGLDCRTAADGSITVWAIERHFEVTTLLAFTLPAGTQGSDEVEPKVLVDLGPVLRGSLNLEGVAVAGGRFVAVVDNQWRTITGPSELLVLKLQAPAL